MADKMFAENHGIFFPSNVYSKLQCFHCSGLELSCASFTSCSFGVYYAYSTLRRVQGFSSSTEGST